MVDNLPEQATLLGFKVKDPNLLANAHNVNTMPTHDSPSHKASMRWALGRVLQRPQMVGVSVEQHLTIPPFVLLCEGDLVLRFGDDGQLQAPSLVNLWQPHDGPGNKAPFRNRCQIGRG